MQQPRSRRSTHALGARRVLALAALGSAAVACGGGGTTPRAHANAAPPSTTRSPSTLAHQIPSVAVTTASWKLPRPSAREVVVADGDHLLLLGGLDADRRTVADVFRIDPRAGSVTPAGMLGTAVHDAAGALVGGVPMVFAGGNSTETAAVQAFEPGPSSRVVGHLPIPRSDLSAVTVGRRTFLVGGYDGSNIRATVLATTDGTKFALLGDLPVPVRYAAVAAVGTNVYVVGGSNGGGAVREVQALDTKTGTVRVIGKLPQGLSDAVAATLGGHVYVFGGNWGGQPSAQIWRLETSGKPGVTLTPVATLPTPVVDAAVAVLGNRAYLVGGESPAPLTSVSILEVR